jgi:hypothetical protein
MDAPKLSRWEVVGAWLRIWTPPRGAVIPPVPWRPMLAVVAVVAVAAVVIGRQVDAGKDRAAVRAAAERAERAAARRAAQAREQRVVVLDRAAVPGLPAVERAITREARRRFAAGELARRPGGTRCRLAPGEVAAAPRVVLDCLAATGRVPNGRGRAGVIGYPFRAVVDRRADRVAFCATNPIPGERVVPDPEDTVRLPAACRANGE